LLTRARFRYLFQGIESGPCSVMAPCAGKPRVTQKATDSHHRSALPKKKATSSSESLLEFYYRFQFSVRVLFVGIPSATGGHNWRK